MRRFAIAGTLTIALVAGLPETAGAGGANFEFDREYYQPGDLVSGRVTFGRGAGYPIRAGAGPFITYLMDLDASIDPPRIPPGAIPVGPMTLSGVESGPWLARVEFTLPDVSPGTYSVGYCNDPCTIASLGELVGGRFTVIPAGEELSTYLLRQRFERGIRSLRGGGSASRIVT
jgi:hypothetical protein